MRMRWILLIGLLSLGLVSCTGSAAVIEQSPDLAPLNPQEFPTGEASPTLSENPLQLSTPESIEMPSNPPPVEKFVALSKKDLVSLLKIDEDKIAFVDATEILWPDAALGCPSPGKFYAQGRVPGYRIRLELEGKEYIYHTDFNGQVILCPQNDPDNPDDSFPPTNSSPTPHIGVPID